MVWVISYLISIILEMLCVYASLKCDARHEDAAEPHSFSKEMSDCWLGFCAIHLLLMLTSGFCLIMSMKTMIENTATSDRELQVKCESIDGIFDKSLDGCYKNGVKIDFDSNEYGDKQ